MFWIKSRKKSKSMEYKDYINKADQLRLPLSLAITPINLEEEKHKFLDSKIYNPMFKYKKYKNSNEYILEELLEVEEITNVHPDILPMLKQIIVDKSQTDKLIKAIGDNKSFSTISKLKYKMPTNSLFHNATLVLKNNLSEYSISIDSNNIKNNDSTKIISKLNKILTFMELKNWTVQYSQNIAKEGFKTGTKTKTIYISDSIKKSNFELMKTVVHEILTHVLRAENGSISGYSFLGKPTTNKYINTEEGLALFNEEYFGYMTYKTIKDRSLMTYAIYIGEKMTFRELFNVMKAFYTPKEAFQLVYRVKRGLSNTNDAGIYTKDTAYFRGFRKIKKLLLKRPNLYSMLYAGKIAYTDLQLVLDGIVPTPKYVPDKTMVKSIRDIVYSAY